MNDNEKPTSDLAKLATLVKAAWADLQAGDLDELKESLEEARTFAQKVTDWRPGRGERGGERNMKPHEETWKKGALSPTDIETSDGSMVADFFDEARAKLAAQAPAMARLWLRHQFADDGLCPDCLGEGKHQVACEIPTALRAAGVIP
jgi:hypothetical protein